MKAKKSDDQAWSNFTIQKAIDAARAGDVVEIPAGEYLLYDALHLRSGVRVFGSPREHSEPAPCEPGEPTPGVVLKKAPSVASRLSAAIILLDSGGTSWLAFLKPCY